jgi:hypothetical protein
VPRQLPAPVTHFAGREGELAVLAGLPGRVGAEMPEAVVISAIDGMAGVGKTTLAVQAGHLLASRFPDRQLFVDLPARRGRSTQPGRSGAPDPR